MNNGEITAGVTDKRVMWCNISFLELLRIVPFKFCCVFIGKKLAEKFLYRMETVEILDDTLLLKSIKFGPGWQPKLRSIFNYTS